MQFDLEKWLAEKSVFADTALGVTKEVVEVEDLRALLAGNVLCNALTVWEGPMPESNGKSNFTAILMRKDGDIVDGITLARSEHPDRVRYEADRARYLIGEKEDRPRILDYDADKHSGNTLDGRQHLEFPA